MIEVKVSTNNVVFGMGLGTQNCPPLLVYNTHGTIALLVRWDNRNMSLQEADAIILHIPSTVEKHIFKVGEYVERLNLEYWLPYERTITISNRK